MSIPGQPGIPGEPQRRDASPQLRGAEQRPPYDVSEDAWNEPSDRPQAPYEDDWDETPAPGYHRRERDRPMSPSGGRGRERTVYVQQQQPRNGLGIAALVLGIVGAVFGLIPLFFLIALTCGIIGLVLGFTGRGRAKRREATNGGTALAGILTSGAAIGLGVVGIAIINDAFSDAEEALDELGRELDDLGRELDELLSGGELNVDSLMDAAGCPGEVIEPQLYALENGRCVLDGNEVDVAVFADNDRRDEWVEIAESTGVTTRVGDEWAVAAIGAAGVDAFVAAIDTG